jgi:hypothetical protein
MFLQNVDNYMQATHCHNKAEDHNIDLMACISMKLILSYLCIYVHQHHLYSQDIYSTEFVRLFACSFVLYLYMVFHPVQQLSYAIARLRNWCSAFYRVDIFLLPTASRPALRPPWPPI